MSAGWLRAEGRIEPSDGTLMCSYHGWRFGGDGKCTNVPQSLDAKANAAACASPRSCAIGHPTQVGHVSDMRTSGFFALLGLWSVQVVPQHVLPFFRWLGNESSQQSSIFALDTAQACHALQGSISGMPKSGHVHTQHICMLHAEDEVMVFCVGASMLGAEQSLGVWLRFHACV